MTDKNREEKPAKKNEGKAEGEGRNDRGQRIQEYKLRKASLPDTSVVYSRVPDTVRVIQIMDRGGDFALNKLRKGIAVRYDVTESLGLLEAVASATRALDVAIGRVCKTVGVDYKSPPGLNAEKKG
jgi:hypothetical protein